MPRRFLLSLAFLLLLPGFIITGPAQCQTKFSPVQEDIFQEALDAGVAKCRVPGAVAAVRSPKGALWQGAADLANIATNEPMRAELHLHIGSLTKSLTATLFLQLVDRGQASLDDTVEKWLPGVLSNGDEINIRQLLQMRSGLAHYESSPAFMEKFLSQPLYQWPPLELVAFCDQEVHPPGSRFDYNNVNYILVGMIIEKALGQPYHLAVRDNILAPLGMAHSEIPMDAGMPAPFARGYLILDGQARDVSTYWDPSAFWAAGSMISTLDDMLVWAEALLGGSLLSPAMHEEQFTFVPTESDPSRGYGLGVGDGNGMVGHNGNYNGLYTAALFRIEGHDVVILSNGQAVGGGPGSTATCILDNFRGVVENHPR